MESSMINNDFPYLFYIFFCEQFFRRFLDRIRYTQLIMIITHITLQNSSIFSIFYLDNTLQHKQRFLL